MIGTDEGKRKELLNFLNQKVFDPILQALPEDYKSEDLKGKLSDVKRRTESEKHYFMNFKPQKRLRKIILLTWTLEQPKK
jgi:hypothetical protein